MKSIFLTFTGIIYFLTIGATSAQTNQENSKSTENQKIKPTYYFINNKMSNEATVVKILKNQKWVKRIKVMTEDSFTKAYHLKIGGNALLIYTKGKEWEATVAP
jgi:hypothetical protein